jgi:hypothetical protein
MMKTPKKTSSTRVVVIALLAATIIVTVVGMAIPIVVNPAYAQLDDDISGEQIVVGEIEIPDSDAIRENVEEITSQSLPRPAELGTILIGPRSPPAFAD